MTTRSEITSLLSEVKPHAFSEGVILHWIDILEGMIEKNILSRYEKEENNTVESGDTDIETDQDESTKELLITETPYTEIYIKWLEAQIDYANGEYDKYNNSISAFEDFYKILEKYYNRTHKSKSKGHFKF